MIAELAVRHYEHVSRKSFDEVVAAFEVAVGSVEEKEYQALVAAAQSAAEFEAVIRSREGSSGFMRFLTVDHGRWLAKIGLHFKARMYTIGNPLIAQTMIRHDIAAGLNVPIRLMIYEEGGTVRLAYDLPSSLMSGLKNAEVTAAAEALDAKLIALAELATGATA
jgi:uncharacterized protein (DUF302 family)